LRSPTEHQQHAAKSDMLSETPTLPLATIVVLMARLARTVTIPGKAAVRGDADSDKAARF
jgi:hypothetical protein